ncbi:hypothetical protein TNCV_2024821 [Trichonephila clavipes]|nr:hypothetical protein TNCV_2024821 [Trichonephila clavipes]
MTNILFYCCIYPHQLCNGRLLPPPPCNVKFGPPIGTVRAIRVRFTYSESSCRARLENLFVHVPVSKTDPTIRGPGVVGPTQLAVVRLWAPRALFPLPRFGGCGGVHYATGLHHLNEAQKFGNHLQLSLL